MTTTNDIKRLKARRMTELFDIARKRYLDEGGNSRKAVNCKEWLTEEEQREFIEISELVVTEEDMANYIKKHGSWRDRYAAAIEKIRLSK